MWILLFIFIILLSKYIIWFLLITIYFENFMHFFNKFCSIVFNLPFFLFLFFFFICYLFYISKFFMFNFMFFIFFFFLNI